MLESTGFCFVLFMLLVLYISWFFSKRSVNISQLKIKQLSDDIIEKEDKIKELESSYIEKKNQIDRLIDDDIICRHRLLQTTNLLRKKSDELYRVQEKLKVVKAKVVYMEKKEIVEKNFTESIEIKKLNSIIDEKDEFIINLKDKLTLDREYINISKDQFSQIEKRLKEYKHKTETLEKENYRLLLHSRLKKEYKFLENINLYISNIKESTLSNLFEREQKLKQI